MSASYRFIASEATNYPVVDLCQALGVSRSGYYEWAGRLESTDELAPRGSEVFWRHSRRYGSRRIAAELQAESKIEGERIGRRRIRRLMRELELEAIQPRRFVPRTTDSRHGQRMSPNLLLERAIKVDRPRQSSGTSPSCRYKAEVGRIWRPGWTCFRVRSSDGKSPAP